MSVSTECAAALLSFRYPSEGPHHSSVIQTPEEVFGWGEVRADPLFQTKLCDFPFPIL